MPRVLVLYSTHDGQTLRIAKRVARVLGECGHSITLMSADDEAAGEAITRHDAAVVGAAIRYGHHARTLERFTRARRGEIESRPNAFFSVCLCAGEHRGAKPQAARRYVEEFRARTGWNPASTASFAGALRYSTYGTGVRWLIRTIMLVNGGETDTSRDHEYTDWTAVERFARDFAARLSSAAAA